MAHDGPTNAVYLLHFDRPLCHAQHYLGSASDLDARLGQHENGNGARLTGVIKELGIGWTLVRVWEFGTRKQAWQAEHRYKTTYKNSRKLCPICRGERS